MNRIIKYISYITLTALVIMLVFYMSLGFIVENNQSYIKEYIDKRIPENISYNSISVVSSFTKGLSFYLRGVTYKEGGNSFFANSVEAKVSIIKSLMQKQLYIDKTCIEETTIKLGEMNIEDSNISIPDFVISNTVQLTNTTVHWRGYKTKKIPYMSVEEISKNQYLVNSEFARQSIHAKIVLNDTNVEIDLSSKYFDLFKWFVNDHASKLEFRDLSAAFVLNSNNMKLESGNIVSSATYKNIKGNRYSSYVIANIKDGLKYIDVNLDNTLLSMADLYSNSIYLDKVKLLAGFQENEIFHIEDLSIQQGEFIYPHMRGDIFYRDNLLSGKLEMDSSEMPIDIGKIWVPDTLFPGVSTWVYDALVVGFITNSKLEFTGRAYKWSASLNKVEIDYDSSWPKISDSSGELVLTEKAISISLNSGAIAEGKINNVLAHIDFEKDNILKVGGKIEMELQKALLFLKTSPLEIDLSNILHMTTTTGKVDISLDLRIPMIQDGKVEVDGVASIKDASFDLSQDLKLPVENFSAEVIFKQDEVYAKNINFKLDGEDSNGEFSSFVNSKEVKISLDSRLNPRSLSKLDPILADKLISGGANYHLDIHVNYKDKVGDVRYDFTSDLLGVEIDLGFYRKKAKDKLDTRALFTDLKTGKQLSLQMENLLDAQLIYNRESWGGHISLGNRTKADKGVGDKLLVSGEIDRLSPSNNMGISDKLKPIKVYLKTKQLILGEHLFNNVWLLYDQEEDANRVSLESPDINGSISIIDDENIKMIFDKLSLTKSGDSLKETEILDERISKISSIEIECEDFIYDNIELGKLRVDAIYKERGFDISILLQQANSALQMSGIWLDPGKSNQTSEISGNWRVADFGNLMSVLGLNKDLSGGDGFVSTYLNWPGSIFNPSKDHINGEINLVLTNGRITTVDPGFGRILGLLSIEQIARRIKLDFSDVTSKGLTYDKLNLEGKISDGRLSISSLLIQSPVANIFIEGTVYLKNQKLNLMMEIAPKVNDTLPVAAAVAAGNPAVGAALWVVDKVVSGSKSTNSSNITSSKYKYWVGGTLSAPEVTKFEQVDSKKRNK